MNITERHRCILQKLKEDGKVDIVQLSKQMGVSGVTIRKDLKLLEDKGLLFRAHGGGSLNSPYANERTIDEKQLLNADEKQRIGKAALSLVGNNDSIMIGSGTTCFELARQLQTTKHITVITSALKVALELSNRANVDVLQLGGLVRPNSSSTTGSHAERLLTEVSCGIVFLGVDGIDLDFGISTTNLAEASLNQKMIESATMVAVLADSTKFNRRGFGRICGLEYVHYIITDNKVTETIIKKIEEKGVKLIVV